MNGNAGSQEVALVTASGAVGAKIESDRNSIPRWVHVKFTTTATVGNRSLKFNFYDKDGNLVYDIRTGVNQAASLVRHYNFIKGVPRETGFQGAGNNEMILPLPDLFWTANYYFTVTDENSVDASDTFELHAQVNY